MKISDVGDRIKHIDLLLGFSGKNIKLKPTDTILKKHVEEQIAPHLIEVAKQANKVKELKNILKDNKLSVNEYIEFRDMINQLPVLEEVDVWQELDK